LRRAAYVGAGTQSAVVTVTPGTGVAAPSPVTATANCTNGACTLVVLAYPGLNTFVINLYDGPNGTGSVVSTGSFPETIVAGAANSFPVTFNGVPAAVSVQANPPMLTGGTAATSTLTVTAYDADRNIITGTAYSPSITLTSVWPHVTFGSMNTATATVSAPGTTVIANYDGTLPAPPALACNGIALITSTIGTTTGPAGGISILCGVILTPSVLTVTSGGGTNTVQVTDPGFSGTISVVSPTGCAVIGSASISPASAVLSTTVTSATFTVTGEASDPGGCPITFTDGTNSASLSVSVM
jgi:hypothetical protein